ncbi:MAG: prepilin-type N-terminal cleavage/methylation domain-containing protein [Deltaproteobacteria bacterium]|nr:prepilin-type N-terminal cleavage/methylation domain-containing protein [Deltaproteobacteria bacterium]
MKKRFARAGQRGTTLVEAMVAVVVLSVGTAAITELLRSISTANRRMDFQTTSLDIFGEFAAQVQDAPCDMFPGVAAPVNDGSTDPGLLLAPPPPGWQEIVPVAGSAITMVGDFGPATGVAATQNRLLNYRVRYNAQPSAPPVGGAGVPAFDLQVEIREITFDPLKDAPATTDGYWIRTFPLKKICNVRTEPEDGRGAYYDIFP